LGAQLTQLASLSVKASKVIGPDGRPVHASELLGGLPALSRLTRLTSLTVEGQSAAGQGGHGASAWDVLQALPPGAPLKQVTVLQRNDVRGARVFREHDPCGHAGT
jgi:hypothetical protein